MKEEKDKVESKPINRFREKYTTIIGVIIMVATVGLWITGYFVELQYELTKLELAGGVALGWVFLRAKDTLIEGLFKGIFTKK